MDNSSYLALITSEHADKEKYVAYVTAFLEELDGTYECLQSFDEIFDINKVLPDTIDLDNPEPGSKKSIVEDQLDKLGQLLNVSRALPVVDPDIPAILDNETYQKVLKAKILADRWDGTTQGLYDIVEELYPGLGYEIVDNQDMSYNVTIISSNLTATDEALLLNGFILPKPAGIEVGYDIVEAPYFGWDSNTTLIKGWNLGTWADN